MATGGAAASGWAASARSGATDVRHLLLAALVMEAFALGGALCAGHAPVWLLVGLVVLSGAGVLLALLSAALRH